MKYGLHEADELSRQEGKFICKYEGSSSKEIKTLEDKLKLLGHHLSLRQDYPVTVRKEDTKIVLDGAYYHLVSGGEVEISSVGKDGKLWDIFVRPTLCKNHNGNAYISLEVRVDGNVYEVPAKPKKRY